MVNSSVPCRVREISSSGLLLSVIPTRVVGPVAAFRRAERDELTAIDHAPRPTSTELLEPRNFRVGDLVELTSGEPGLVKAVRNGRLEVLTRDGIVDSEFIASEIRSAARVTDVHGRVICVGDRLRRGGRRWRAVAIHPRCVFGESEQGFSCLCPWQISVIGPDTDKERLIGKYIMKIGSAMEKDVPFVVRTVSRNGCVIASDGRFVGQFMFVDFQRTWRFITESDQP
jgi:hypothetical protein